MPGIRILMVVFAAFVVASAQASIWYVDDDAPAGGNGQSWGSAFRFLESAFSAAQNGDEIRVAGGTYRPSTTEGFRSFGLALEIKGGFAGLAQPGNPDGRDFVQFPAILSGDLNSNDDGSPDSYFDNATSVLTLGPSPVNFTVVSGLRIHASRGVGLAITQPCELVEDCEFFDNLENGVAFQPAYDYFGELIFRRIVIRRSREGIYSSHNRVIFFENSLIEDNQHGLVVNNVVASRCTFSRNGSRTIVGGAIQAMYVNAYDCDFRNNTAQMGGAVYGNCFAERTLFYENSAQFGGALAGQPNVAINVRACQFVGNSATGLLVGKGGAIFSDNPVGPTINDCLFVLNLSSGDGGAVSSKTATLISSSTFVDNLAVFFGGAVSTSGTGIGRIGNCILWGNVAAFGSQCSVAQGELRIAFSDIQNGENGTGGTYADAGGRVIFGLGNLSTDPRFVSASADDYRLAPDSPCIDAGLNAIVQSEVDLASVTRRIDDPDTLDTGLGEPPLVDMGAYEFLPGPLPGDCIGNTDGDTDVDLQDLATLLAHFGQTSGATIADGDTNADGGVDLQDLANLLAHFGAPCP